jgi:acetyl-CoA carboxylase biotin carboxyl carrier protein
MLKMHELRELIKLIDQSQGIEVFELDQEGSKVMIQKTKGRLQYGYMPSEEAVESQIETAEESPRRVTSPVEPKPAAAAPAKPAQPEAATAVVDSPLHKIVSPMVGTFYRAPSPDAAPYVKEGDRVDEKTVVCIVEAMKLMNEIEAEVRGEIVKVLVENGQLVEYGQPMFLVKPE